MSQEMSQKMSLKTSPKMSLKNSWKKSILTKLDKYIIIFKGLTLLFQFGVKIAQNYIRNIANVDEHLI
jgi:hypothetical protein